MRGDERLNGRSDVYSLGATLYHALAGQAPFRDDDLEAILHRVLWREPAPLSSLASGLPRDLGLVVHKALEQEPERRYASAADFAADLEAVLELRPVSAKRPGPLGRALRWTRRNKTAALGLGATTLSLAAAAAWISRNQHTVRVARPEEAAENFQQPDLELAAFRASRLALASDEAEFDRIWLLQEYQHLGDEKPTRLGAIEADVRAARKARDTAFARANKAIDASVRLDPSLANAARTLRAELVLERLREAQDKKDQDAVEFLRVELNRPDVDGELTDRAFPFARLTIAGTLPDMHAWLFRYVALNTDEAVLSRARIEPIEWRSIPVPELPGEPKWPPAAWHEGSPRRRLARRSCASGRRSRNSTSGRATCSFRWRAPRSPAVPSCAASTRTPSGASRRCCRGIVRPSSPRSSSPTPWTTRSSRPPSATTSPAASSS